MGWKRRHQEVIEERLVYWFMYKKTFPMSIEEFSYLRKQLIKPLHLSHQQREKMKEFLKVTANGPQVPTISSTI